jgi:hypothetical protein
MPSMRSGHLSFVIRQALARASRDGFRLLQFSVQCDHLHLLVEADEPTRLTRGVQGLAIRVAKAVNRVLGRHGRVWGDRYHARTLFTPREVRNALVYVLNNWRKHVPKAGGLDPHSSAAWFTGWLRVRPRSDPPPVPAARTWLATVGWRRLGLLGIGESPRRRMRPRGL